MKKKLIVSVLCAAMAASSLAGCGLKSPDEPTTAASAAETTAAAGETTAAPAGDSAGGSGAYNTDDMPEITLVYAEVNPLDTIVGQMATDFKTKVEELSDGKITIDVQASGVLGSENDVLDTMLGGGGTIEMSRIDRKSTRQNSSHIH